ncbi:MAG TPA: hypothetical protein VF553_14380 [Pyrinomonadaceae bacterium]|jgi:hypothetical protein
MKSVENNPQHSSSIRAYFEEQSALVRAGGYWNCLTAARKLSALLLAEGHSPWIARLRKTELVGGQVFHAPLIPRLQGVAAAWTTHYICCCDEIAYDPVAGEAIRLEVYSSQVFGMEISLEVFVTSTELPAYLANLGFHERP